MCREMDYDFFVERKKAQEALIKQKQRAEVVEKLAGQLSAKKAKLNAYAFLVVGEGIEKAQPAH